MESKQHVLVWRRMRGNNAGESRNRRGKSRNLPDTRARARTGTVLRNPSVLCLRVRAEQKQNLKHLWGTVVRALLATHISVNVCLIWAVTSRRGRGHECFAWELSEELFRRNTIILSNSLLKPKEAWRSGFSSFNDTITNNTSIYGFFKSTQAL